MAHLETVTGAAKRTGIPRTTLARWVKDGRLPSSTAGASGRVQVWSGDVDNLANSRIGAAGDQFRAVWLDALRATLQSGLSPREAAKAADEALRLWAERWRP